MITLTREVKKSDGNYGNYTKKITIDVSSCDLPKAEQLLNEWEQLSSINTNINDEDVLTVAEMRIKTKAVERLNALLQDIAYIAQ